MVAVVLALEWLLPVVPALVVVTLIVTGRLWRDRPWGLGVRCLIAIVVGYLVLNATVIGLTEVTFRMAVAREGYERAASHDTGSALCMAFTAFFGWIPVALYVGFLALVRWIARSIRGRGLRTGDAGL